jgi:hypothetical protein
VPTVKLFCANKVAEQKASRKKQAMRVSFMTGAV